MYLVDYHTHPHAHGETRVDMQLLKEFIYKAEDRGLSELGFSDHDEFQDGIKWEHFKQIKNTSNIDIRLGLEFDYRPEKEEMIGEIITGLPLDYTIGSVHAIGSWEVDHPDYIDEYEKRDIIDAYHRYFELVEAAAASGLFNIIGHLDLIKVFGFRPEGLDILTIVEPVLRVIKENMLVIEVNTNGFNKPIQEQYPSLKILKRAAELEIPFTFGSDAHTADRVGEGIKEYLSFMNEIGYNQIATFNQGEMTLVEINTIFD